MRNYGVLWFFLAIFSCTPQVKHSHDEIVEFLSTVQDQELVQFAIGDKRLTPVPSAPGIGFRVSSPPPPEKALATKELRFRHPYWNWASIEKEEVTPGMSGHEVMLAWGKPGTIRMLDGKEIWIIGGRRLEFSEGKLISSR